MSKPAFPGIEPIRYQPDAPANALAFRYYDKDKKVRGKRMEDHLRMAVCYWHTFVWNGFDVFGAGTFERPGTGRRDAVELAKEKAAAAFEFFSKLGVPFFCFHDRDVAPEGAVAGRDQRHPRPDRRRARSGDAADGREAAVGDGEPVLAPALHGRRGDQPRSRRCSRSRPRR